MVVVPTPPLLNMSSSSHAFLARPCIAAIPALDECGESSEPSYGSHRAPRDDIDDDNDDDDDDDASAVHHHVRRAHRPCPCRLAATIAAPGTTHPNSSSLGPEVLTVLGGKASCRRKFVVHVHLLDPEGRIVPRDVPLVASVAFAHDRSPVRPPASDSGAGGGEPPLFTTFNGVEFPAHDHPTRMVAGRATFKLALSLLSSKFDNRLFSICFTPQWPDNTTTTTTTNNNNDNNNKCNNNNNNNKCNNNKCNNNEEEEEEDSAFLCEPCFSSPIRSISRKRASTASASASAPAPPPLNLHVNHHHQHFNNRRYVPPTHLMLATSPPRVMTPAQLSPDHSSSDDHHGHYHPNSATHPSNPSLLSTTPRSVNVPGNVCTEQQLFMLNMQQRRSRLTPSPVESLCSPHNNNNNNNNNNNDSASESTCTIDHHNHHHHQFQFSTSNSSSAIAGPHHHHHHHQQQHPHRHYNHNVLNPMCSSCNAAQMNLHRPLSAPSPPVSGGGSRLLIRPRASVGVCRLPFVLGNNCNNNPPPDVSKATTTHNIKSNQSMLVAAQQGGGSSARETSVHDKLSRGNNNTGMEPAVRHHPRIGVDMDTEVRSMNKQRCAGGSKASDREAMAEAARSEVEEQERAIHYLELTLYEVSREIHKRKEEVRMKRRRLIMAGIVPREEMEEEEEEEEEEERNLHNFAISPWINSLTTTKLTH